MRQEFLDRLKELIQEKRIGSWKDGWVYGRLKQEFTLQSDELGKLAEVLGFKYGWNRVVEELLEEQWRSQELLWMEQQRLKLKQKVDANRQKADLSSKIDELLRELENPSQPQKPAKPLTKIEHALVSLILKMKEEEQLWLLEVIFNRYK
uniref:ATPase central domain-containing protein n=1 Tax=Cyanothece sp. (strain PCC 7425 / ATCC 29141) TaxID=395961 RepID=B8HM01_CYAP4